VPTPEEYSALLEDWGNPDIFVHANQYRSNEDVAREEPGDLLFASNDLAAIAASGRETGYLAGYSGGRDDFSCCTARVAIDLYQNEESAQRRMEGPLFYPTPSFRPKGIAVEAVAWLVAQSNDDRVCPCELWFRVGPIVGAVVTSYHGPFGGGEAKLDPIQEQLALLIAEHMREALAAS